MKVLNPKGEQGELAVLPTLKLFVKQHRKAFIAAAVIGTEIASVAIGSWLNKKYSLKK